MSRKSIGSAIALALILSGGAQAADLRLLCELGQDQSGGRHNGRAFHARRRGRDQGRIKFVSNGPETVPPFEQFQPVSAGAFQMLFTHAVYHYGTTGIGMGLDAVGGNPKNRRVRHDRADGQGLPEARGQGRSRSRVRRPAVITSCCARR